MLVNQPTATPTSKVAAVGASGAIVALVVTILTSFGVILPEGLSDQATAAVAAVITLVTFSQAAIQFAAGYFKRENV